MHQFSMSFPLPSQIIPSAMMQELVLKLGSQLHYFCLMGDVDNVLKCLKGRDDNLFTMDDCNYWTPAHWAANYDKSECLALLKSYDAVDTPSFRSMAIPLHIACERGNYNCVRVLLGPNCKLNSQDYQGDTPLHKAAAGGHLNCIQLLILAGAQINVRNFSNRTPTEVAAMAGHFEVASTLNEITAHQNQQNSISTRDPNKDNHCAAPLCRTSVGNCFKRQNAPDFDDPLDKRRKYNDPVMQIAVDLIGKSQDNVQSSVLEHAASMSMANTYADYYSQYLNTCGTLHRS